MLIGIDTTANMATLKTTLFIALPHSTDGERVSLACRNGLHFDRNWPLDIVAVLAGRKQAQLDHLD